MKRLKDKKKHKTEKLSYDRTQMWLVVTQIKASTNKIIIVIIIMNNVLMQLCYYNACARTIALYEYTYEYMCMYNHDICVKR